MHLHNQLGHYEFPFAFYLPKDLTLPTSFENPLSYFGAGGYIRYKLTAGILLSLGRFGYDYVTIKGITVHDNIDLNAPRLLCCLSSSKEKTVCCLCCASGPVVMTVSTDIRRSGYCLGEDAENHSKRRVDSIRESLKQTTIYYGIPTIDDIEEC